MFLLISSGWFVCVTPTPGVPPGCPCIVYWFFVVKCLTHLLIYSLVHFSRLFTHPLVPPRSLPSYLSRLSFTHLTTTGVTQETTLRRKNIKNRRVHNQVSPNPYTANSHKKFFSDPTSNPIAVLTMTLLPSTLSSTCFPLYYFSSNYPIFFIPLPTPPSVL